MNNARPLKDVLVVSLECALAGPLCTAHLSDLGARVIKVEPPGKGDHAHYTDNVLGPWSSFDLWANCGKDSLTLDLKQPRARGVVLRLAERADIIVANLRPGMIDEYGYHFELFRERNPRIVLCHVSGFGRSGPHQNRKAFEQILQGESGLILVNGLPDAPARVGVSIVDAGTAIYATAAILAGLHQARSTGIGVEIDVSMLEATVSFLSSPAYRYWNKGETPKRGGARHATIIPNGVYEAADGPFNLTVITVQMWVAFCNIIGCPELSDDPRCQSAELRGQHSRELDGIIEPLLRTRPRAEWMALFDKAGIPCGAVNTLAEALVNPQLIQRGFFTELPSPYGPVRLVNFPARFDNRFLAARHLPRAVGEDSDGILAEFGYSERDIANLRQEGVV